MKKAIILIIALCTAIAANAQTIKFERLNHNFGALVYRGEAQSVVMPFTNTGERPLVIIRSQVECSCITVKIPRQPISAGGTGEIVITYNPNKDLGAFHKGVEIYTNASAPRTILVMEGEVVRKRR